MSRAGYGSSTDLLLLALQDLGEGTRVQISKAAGLDPKNTGPLIARLLKVCKNGPHKGQRRIHIAEWTDEQVGMRCYPRAIYAPGDGEDAPKPRAKCIKVLKRGYRERDKRRAAVPGLELQRAWGGQ